MFMLIVGGWYNIISDSIGIHAYIYIFIILYICMYMYIIYTYTCSHIQYITIYVLTYPNLGQTAFILI